MRRWRRDAPRWVLALLTGVPFGATMGLFFGIRDGSWLGGVIAGLGAGALFGLLMAPVLARQNRSVRKAVGELSDESRRAATRAAWRGPAPEDPEVRAAAARLIGVQLAQTRRTRTFSLVVLTSCLALEIYQAVVSSPWFWVAAAFFGAMLVLVLLLPRLLARRLDRLRAGLPRDRLPADDAPG